VSAGLVAASPAVLALVALLVALVLAGTSRVNVGLLAISLAWLIGVYAGRPVVGAVVRGFPVALFVILTGVTLLFSVARANGTIEILAARAARLVRGNAGLLPIMFFGLAFVLSMVGPGAIASVALVAPIAMPTAVRAGVSNLLMAIMVGTGANAGNLSPVSAIGAMVGSLLARIGLAGQEWRVWAASFLVHVIVAFVAYLLFGGWHLLRARGDGDDADAGADDDGVAPLPPTESAFSEASPVDPAAAVARPAIAFDRRHRLTMGVIALWIVGVVALRVDVGLAAFFAATLLIVLRAADERDAIRGIPLDVILMVCGVSMLIALLETTGGMALFTGLIARLATPATIDGIIALVTGVISTYSSTSGVVLPAFLPMVPELVRQVGGGDPLAVAISINVGSALVDVSPLSTLGALCVAAVADRLASRTLFNQLLIWGLSMTVVAAVLCQMFAGAFAGR
jgi:Na+/H+ antiporter NhaD/arsenite permease-like protein